MIHVSELKEVMERSGYNLSQEEVEQIVIEIDYSRDGKINYSEFLSATLDIKSFLTKQKTRAIFNQFDTDKTGHISAENIQFAMEKLG